MVIYTDLGSWLAAVEASFSRTFRAVHMTAVGIVTGSPAFNSPHCDKRWHDWRPGRYGYITSASFRPATPVGRPPGHHSVGVVTGSPALGAPWVGLVITQDRTFGEFARRHRWRPIFTRRE
jgi:hypothetical protein